MQQITDLEICVQGNRKRAGPSGSSLSWMSTSEPILAVLSQRSSRQTSAFTHASPGNTESADLKCYMVVPNTDLELLLPNNVLLGQFVSSSLHTHTKLAANPCKQMKAHRLRDFTRLNNTFELLHDKRANPHWRGKAHTVSLGAQ